MGTLYLKKKEEEVKALKVIIFLIISLCFITYGMAFMLGQGITGTFLDQGYYRTIVGDNDIPAIAHEQIAGMIPDIVTNGITGGATITDPAMKAAVDAQVELISDSIVDALDESWIADQAALITDDLVHSLTTPDVSKLSAAIDLTDRLDIIQKNIEKGLDKFSDAELITMFGAPKAYIPQIAEKIVAQLGLPESVDVGEIVDSSAPGTIDMVKGYLGTMKTALGPILMIIVVVVFFILCILGFKLSGGLKWFGVTVILSSLVFFLVTNLASSLDRIGSITGMDFGTLPVPSDAIQNIVSFTFGEMNVLPIIFIVVGAISLILGIFIPKKKA